METEIMNNIEEVQETVVEEVVTNDAFKNAGKIGLIGLGVVGAGFALYKLGKKVVAVVKAKKAEKDEDPFEGIHDIKGVDDTEE